MLPRFMYWCRCRYQQKWSIRASQHELRVQQATTSTSCSMAHWSLLWVTLPQVTQQHRVVCATSSFTFFLFKQCFPYLLLQISLPSARTFSLAFCGDILLDFGNSSMNVQNTRNNWDQENCANKNLAHTLTPLWYEVLFPVVWALQALHYTGPCEVRGCCKCGCSNPETSHEQASKPCKNASCGLAHFQVERARAVQKIELSHRSTQHQLWSFPLPSPERGSATNRTCCTCRDPSKDKKSLHPGLGGAEI